MQKYVLLYYYAVNFFVFLAKNQFSNDFLYRKIILIKIKIKSIVAHIFPISFIFSRRADGSVVEHPTLDARVPGSILGEVSFF